MQELPCGHFMHSHCFAQYTRFNYTCPVCSKSMGDMSIYFGMLDSIVARDLADLPSAYQMRQQVRLPAQHLIGSSCCSSVSRTPGQGPGLAPHRHLRTGTSCDELCTPGSMYSRLFCHGHAICVKKHSADVHSWQGGPEHLL